MMEVATGGGAAAASTRVENTTTSGSGGGSGKGGRGSLNCVRKQQEVMPMLLVVPRFSGWPEGFSMLGLGDIIFPSLLLAFALRYDYRVGRGIFGASKRSESESLDDALASQSFLEEQQRHVFSKIDGDDGASAGAAALSRDGEGSKKEGVGYFVVLLAGYAVGLLLALLANMLGLTINGVRGQPALLYLVPCTLGPLCILARQRGEFAVLWSPPSKAGEEETESHQDVREQAEGVDLPGKELR